MEKSSPVIRELPAPVLEKRNEGKLRRFTSHLLILTVVFLLLIKHYGSDFLSNTRDVAVSKQCKQVDPLQPSTDNAALEEMFEYISSSTFEKNSIARLSEAVQIPTESFDNFGPIGEDPRFDILYDFQKFLKNTFPKVHETFDAEVINTHGLVFTLQGTDKNLKPLLLLAHQDVVPVPNATVGAWTHPPFSGHYDGRYIWGRGSSDCKNQLIALMETMELFVDAGFKPKRTIILSFGFDEEVNGRRGAGRIAPFLLDRYGKGGIAALVDEGDTFKKLWGTVFAAPGTSEKGATDVFITIRMPGGHSSIPSDHTSIGVLSELITKIESQQYPTYLASANPYLGQLHCGAGNAPSFPSKLKALLASHKPHHHRTNKPDLLALEAAKEGPATRYLMQTSQAVDIIEGGVKSNALPERVSATVNHRVNIGDTPEQVWEHLTSLAKPIAEKYNLTLHAFDGVAEAPMSISLSHSDTTTYTAPVTPTDVTKTSPYSIFAGTIRALYGEEIVVSPGYMTGNTDTRYYWDLTKHIFRFGPGYDSREEKPGLGNIHTVDERVSVVNHVAAVKWFTLFVRNMDEASLED